MAFRSRKGLRATALPCAYAALLKSPTRVMAGLGPAIHAAPSGAP